MLDLVKLLGILAFAGGFVGMMLSPIHLCLALTRVYFKAEWGGIYQRLVPSALLFIAIAATALLVRRRWTAALPISASPDFEV